MSACVVCVFMGLVKRLTLYCVCDHEHFMVFDTAFFFNKTLEVLRNILVLLVVVLRE